MRRLRGRHRATLALLVAVVAFSLIRKLDRSEIAYLIGDVDWSRVAIAAALSVVPLTLRGLRAVTVYHRAGYAIAGGTLTALTIRNHALGSFTGTSAAATLSAHRVPTRNAVALSAYERIIEFTTLFLLLGAALLVTLASTAIAAGVILFGAASLLVVLTITFRWLQVAAGFYGLASTFAARLLPTEAVATALIGPRLFTSTLLLTLAVFAFEALQALLVMQALGLDVNLAEAWVIVAIGMVTGMAALLPLSLGTQDVGAVWAVGIYGFGTSVGVAAALLLRLAVTLPALLLGGLALLIGGGSHPVQPAASDTASDEVGDVANDPTPERDVEGFFRSP
ncbi:MAG TPA: lysylphosphatidylglycerol synthase domain-containing protein [Dehalococcoidia bacterium]|nr:lysylphosphatidylglycerol synthase domain-containing protein [Dehalococcoidia bacterium]